ncbi:MAG TPA: hypothetical protein VJX67_01645, partial [Blastocatellia bacterium]|nr:hypothetical protein [Blastocatellia bacterium]
MNGEESLRRYLSRSALEQSDPQGQHLAEDQMIKFYRGGKLPPGDQSTLRAHLTECAQCIELFKDVRDFFEPPRHEEKDTPVFEAARTWRGLESRLGLDHKRVVDVGTRVGRSRFVPIFTSALAASLILVTALGAIWIVRLKNHEREMTGQFQAEERSYAGRLSAAERAQAVASEQAEATRQEYEEKLKQEKQHAQSEQGTARAGGRIPPLLNVPIFDVFPEESVERSGSGSVPKATQITAAAESFVLILNGGAQSEYPSYRIEIVDHLDKIIWRASGVKRDRMGNFSLLLSKSVTPPGSYAIRLYGRLNN